MFGPLLYLTFIRAIFHVECLNLINNSFDSVRTTQSEESSEESDRWDYKRNRKIKVI